MIGSAVRVGRRGDECACAHAIGEELRPGPGTKIPMASVMTHLARRSQAASRVASGVLRSGGLPVVAEARCHGRRRFGGD